MGVSATGGAQIAAQGQTVFTRHHHVEHQQIHARTLQLLAHLAAVGGRAAPEAVLLQVLRGQLANFGVVVDQQDMVCGGGHVRMIRAPCVFFVSKHVCTGRRHKRLQKARAQTRHTRTFSFQ